MDNQIPDQNIRKGFLQSVWLAVFLPIQALWRTDRIPSIPVALSEIDRVTQSLNGRLKRQLRESKFQLLSEV